MLTPISQFDVNEQAGGDGAKHERWQALSLHGCLLFHALIAGRMQLENEPASAEAQASAKISARAADSRPRSPHQSAEAATEATLSQTDRAPHSCPRPKPVALKTSQSPPAPGRRPDADDTQAAGETSPSPVEDFAICRRRAGGARRQLHRSPKCRRRPAMHGAIRSQITEIATPAGRIDFPGEPILNCIFAKQFTSWVSDIASPVVKAHDGSSAGILDRARL